MKYLICEECDGYYKLKEGETAEDFESCECGGKLKEVENLENINNTPTEIKEDKNENNDRLEENERKGKHEWIWNGTGVTAQKISTKSSNTPNPSTKPSTNKEIKYSMWTGKPIKEKSTKSKNDSIEGKIKNYWDKQTSERKKRIIIILITILLLSTIIYAIFSPKITPLSINSPISLENNEIGKYSYDFFSTNSLDNVVVSGKTDPNARVKVYVTYGNTLDDANEFYSSELMNNQSIPLDIQNYSHAKDDPGPDGYESGRPFDVPVDNNTGNFNLEIPLNPNFGHAWVYIVSQLPKKEHNMLEVIVVIPNDLQNKIQSNITGTVDNTSTATSEGTSLDYDKGYDEGYFNGINDAYDGSPYEDGTSKTLQVTDMWKQGFKDGYKQGYGDIQNNNPLQKPRIPGTAILDPRTGEQIYA